MTRSLTILTVLAILAGCNKTNRIELSIPDTGWQLWPDTAAIWRKDKLFLPGEFHLDQLPVNAPTCGWDALSSVGIPVRLPSTVEQHFWGKLSKRPYKNDEYYYALYDTSLMNGNYEGVSWWSKEIYIPREFTGKTVDLFIRGARQRAEVYLNRQLIGYSMIEEVSFTCDATPAIIPGRKNLLAIRITNPGGRLDWIDNLVTTWDSVFFQRSHGFGGLDRGMVLRAHDQLFISDLYVLNTPNPKRINAYAQVTNRTAAEVRGNIEFRILTTDQQICEKVSVPFNIKPGEKETIQTALEYKDAITWSNKSPKLYTMKAVLSSSAGNYSDEQKRMFGFRWFAPDGIGSNAVLRLNGERVRLVSAISWGFWGLNGLFPTPELALKEVTAAKTLGLNCIQFHRNPGKTEVLDAQDNLGLYRYMEPGGGMTGLLNINELEKGLPGYDSLTGEPNLFAFRYMEEKILGMMRDHRSHPSLLMYCVQNEMNDPDLRNPRIDHLFRKMQATDPSRVIILTSGVPPTNQQWVKPYNDTLFKDDGTGYSGWFDKHTVGGPGVWQDALYTHPDSFTHRSVNQKEIVCWGEMLGSACPDNHQLMINQLKHTPGSYDYADHTAILTGYSNFINKWRFNSGFPTPSALFEQIGTKCYDFWGRVIETSKLAEANDFLVISGWESTTIENHSGLVDNLRNFKADVSLMNQRLQPLRPVFKPRTIIAEAGKTLAFDIFLINETRQPVTGKLVLQCISPSGKKSITGTFSIPSFVKDKFVYSLATNATTEPLTEEGMYRFRLTLNNSWEHSIEESVLVIHPAGQIASIPMPVAVLTDCDSAVIAGLEKLGIKAEPYNQTKKYGILITGSLIRYGSRFQIDDPTQDILNTDDDILYHDASTYGYPFPYNELEYYIRDIKATEAKVTLYMADIGRNPTINVKINGIKVLDKFNIRKEAGGRYTAIQRVFTVPVKNGVIDIDPGYRSSICAILIETPDTVMAINCGGKTYTDKTGRVWHEYHESPLINKEIIEAVRNGMNLLVLPRSNDAADEYARVLANAGAFSYSGHIGGTRASWMGAWVFNRHHPIFYSMPVNTVLGSYYQLTIDGGDGLFVDGNNVVVAAGCSRDHDPAVGATCFTSTLGKGKIVFNALPGLINALQDNPKQIHPLAGKKIVTNSLRLLAK